MSGRTRSAVHALSAPGARLGLLAAVIGFGIATNVSCLLELPVSMACGDGYHDVEAGEECDPGDPDSFLNKCVTTSRPDGQGACDPITCELIIDVEQCAVCGDGRVDEIVGEQCDGDELNGRSCLGGVGTLQCTTSCLYDYSECRDCGNGRLDPGEECDPNSDGGTLTMGKPPCVDLDSPFETIPYTAGTPGECGDDCRWNRTGCNYCGNGRVDDSLDVDFEGTQQALPEKCDGTNFDAISIERQFATSACSQNNPSTRPIIECSDDCLELIPLELEQPCCIKSGAPCPTLSNLQCCSDIEQPENGLDACLFILDEKGNFNEVCR